MSSVLKKNFEENIHSAGERDFYTNLFSSDSEDEISSTRDAESLFHLDGEQGVRTLHIKEKLRELDLEFNMEDEVNGYSDENSDMSLSSGGSMTFVSVLGDDATHITDDIPENIEIQPFSEDQMDTLLKDNSENFVASKNQQLQHSIEASSSPDSEELDDLSPHEDIIGTFNIQNKYDHGVAAQLFLEGNFTFLSLQEPHASHNKISDTWKSCRRLELDSARISCHETQHQVILYDAWKWGGKVISSFQSKQNGRIVHMAFEFGKNEYLGIISVYAFARGGGSDIDQDQREKLRQTTVQLVRQQYRKWLRQFPTINIMIMGDMQETVTTLDIDNLGKSRFINNKKNGIVKAFGDSHVSLARERSTDPSYLTRIGREGARGIDHILFPDQIAAQALIKSAEVHSHFGSAFFPSDHKLISCTYYRKGNNNSESLPGPTKYNFGKISQIKISRCIIDGVPVLGLDESQFKGSTKFQEQKELYNRIQELTGDNGAATKYHLDALERRIQDLYSSLWNAGVAQDCCGSTNKLVEISEYHAVTLSFVMNKYDEAIKDTMIFLHLTREDNCLVKKATARNNVRLKENFKMFENLPMSTKLRYIRGSIQLKKRSIQSYMKFFRERKLISPQQSIDMMQVKELFHKWSRVLNTERVIKQSSKAYSDYMLEAEERTDHINSIQTMQGRGSKIEVQPFQLENIPETTVNLINSWMQESQCNQHFQTNSKTDRFLFLLTEMTEWASNLSHLTPIIKDANLDNEAIALLLKEFDKAEAALSKLEKKIGNAQRKYRADTIHYLLQVNRIEDFVRKIKPKQRDAPATHTEIWDERLQQFRNCRNEKEELIATGNFHGHWMSNSKAPETCAFAKIKHSGRLGARGVLLNPDRKVTKEDVPNLIKNGNRIPLAMRQRFLQAHGKHTADLFRAPKHANPALNYPFFLNSESGAMHNEEDYRNIFLKSLTSIPGKARYEGFHLAVIGRFGLRWQRCLYNISKLILLMRYIPHRLKVIARFPIPKPGRVNEYRPISLCHDLYCFINAISTIHSSRGIEKAQILHEGITAYIKGKGCTTLVGVEQGLREDCVESGIPTSQTDEDEEKFFDRIPVEILLAAMKVNGFPDQGFIELKASGMEAKTVEIITAKGVAHARFICGLEQGNPDSPTISNLVIKFKHDIWRDIIRDIDLKNRNDLETENQGNSKNKDAYRFRISDPLDGIVLIDQIGYCDDNSRFTSSYNEKDVLDATKKFIERAGDLSLVTKIGRKGSKSEIHYFNLSAETALKVKKLESLAWSFSDDAPKFEKVPFKIALQPEELKKVFILTDFEKLDDDAQSNILNIFQSKPHKHLGLKSTLTGVTSSASKEVITKIKARIQGLKLTQLESKAQQQAANMLCSTIHSFAPLQMNHNSNDLEDCDKAIIQQISKRHGLSLTDAKHALFLDFDKGGFGFKSFLDVDLIPTIRELEIVLNGFMIDSKVSRSRLRAYKCRHDKESDFYSLNFIGNAIRKIAKHGFHVRDKYDGVINHVFKELSAQKRYLSTGHANFTCTNNFSMGTGKERGLDIAYGSITHHVLQNSINALTGEWTDNKILHEKLLVPISVRRLERLASSQQYKQFEDKTVLYNFWEWNYVKSNSTNYKNKKEWRYINVMEYIKEKNPVTYWKLSDDEIYNEALLLSEKQLLDGGVVNMIKESKGPAIFATDGSHSNDGDVKAPKDMTHNTTSATVICLADVKDNESWDEEKWKDRVAIPIYARASSLPKFFGVHKSDIGHGEGIAVCMALDLLNSNLKGAIVMDSKSIREMALAIRDRDDKEIISRAYIRKTISGVGKCIGSKMERAFVRMENKGISDKEDADKLEKFVEVSHNWTDTNLEQQSNNGISVTTSWSKRYWDNNNLVPILKVDSHQLHVDGTKIKSRPRYPSLVPNLFLLSCNHHADMCADLIAHSIFDTPDIPTTISIPESQLRFTITWGGKGIDKHVSDFAHEMIQRERLKRLQTKATQGLPWRLIHTSKEWSELRGMKRLMQSLKGFSRTHSRSVYKSTVYRSICMNRKLRNCDPEKQNYLSQLSKNEWNKILVTCTWCENHAKMKGNRYHSILFCKHDNLESFRQRMIRLMESKLFDFALVIKETQNAAECESFLENIERTMQKLHKIDQIPESDRHRWYRTREEWMVEEGYENWKDLENSLTPIYNHIFGMVPVLEVDLSSDMEINAALGISLGIIPIEIEKSVALMSRGIHKFSGDEVWCKQIKNTYRHRWLEIKELLWAKIMGMHSIIGTTSSDMEMQSRKSETKRSRNEIIFNNSRSTRSILRKSSNLIAPEKTKKRKKVHFEQNSVSKKYCRGVTCNTQFKDQNFLGASPSKIPFNKKHCQRCSRQHTAMRSSVSILKQCQETKLEPEVSELVQHIDDHANSLQYSATVEKINTKTNRSPLTPLKGKRLSDTQKNIIKTISTSITRSTSRKQDAQTRLSEAIQNLTETDVKIDKFLKIDLKRTIQEENDLPTPESKIQKKIKVTSCDGKAIKIEEKIWTSCKEEKLNREDVKQTLERRTYMSSRTMHRAIVNIRLKAPQHTYIAVPSATSIIANLAMDFLWEDFAIMFRSEEVCKKKPNGTYLIPIFSGTNDSGHWSFVTVYKGFKERRMWVMDSLGTGHMGAPVMKSIKKAFSSGRLKCRFMEVKCRTQTEVECGPRTISGMVSICNSLAKGDSIDAAISKGSLEAPIPNGYDPVDFRRKAAEWVQETNESKNQHEQREVRFRRYMSKRRKSRRQRGAASFDKKEIECISLE